MPFSRLVACLSQPCIPVHAKDVRILHSPVQFHNMLLSFLGLFIAASLIPRQSMISRAKRRVFLSSLYIGTSEEHLVQSLHNSLSSNPRLTLHLHLDLLRSTRPGPSSAASLLSPLVASFPDRVHVHLFRSPKLKGTLARLVPRRFDEGWGTWHAKVYGVDDEVILSGANLSQSYFTNRQDRYLHFSSSPALSSYCFEFLRLFSHLSYRLLPSESSQTPFVLHWPNVNVEPTRIELAAERALTQFHSSQFRTRGPPTVDTLVVPMIQAGHLNVREEERCIGLLFSHLASMVDAARGVIDLTSGYFALHQPYQDLLINSPASSRIIAASPKANGFFGSKGISGRIPEAYTLLERRFWQKVLDANRAQSVGSTTGIELNEWEKGDWTYHAKGLWYRPTSTSLPELTLFGSTNLNSRSANLDTELSFLMVTNSQLLRAQLDAEVANLRAGAHKVDEKDWSVKERRVRLGTRTLVAAGIEGML